jgi:hypothetical protein
MSHWNYRVLRLAGQCAIHEVFYGDDGVPQGYTEGPVFPRGANLEELRQEAARYLRALEEPVLTPEQFRRSEA